MGRTYFVGTRNLMAAAMLILLLVTAVSGQVAEAPKGRMEGMVLHAKTGEPLIGAKVSLSRIDPVSGSLVRQGAVIGVSRSTGGVRPPAPLNESGGGGIPESAPGSSELTILSPVTTGRNGSFVITGLEAGSYHMTVQRNGFVKQEYGQRVYPGQGITLTLGAGEVMNGMVVRLVETGNVAGLVRNTSGEFAVGTPVQLLKASFSPFGQKILQSVGSTRTDDRGEYRLYWVTPGKYYVAAGDDSGRQGLEMRSPVTSNEPNENYTFTYYPGVADVNLASVVDVGAGDEVRVDFPVSSPGHHRVRGRVIDSETGRPPASIRASLAFGLLTGGGGEVIFRTVYDRDSGIFEFADVTQGLYVLRLSAPGAVGEMPVEVRGDVEGLSVVVSRGMTIDGRLVVENDPAPSPADRVQVQLRKIQEDVGTVAVGTLSSLSTPLAPDGTFRFNNVLTGNYRVSISSAGKRFYLKKALLGSTNVLDQPLQVSNPMPDASLNLAISSNIGQVQGLVLDRTQQPFPGAQVVLIPTKDRNRVELYGTATTDEDGRFTISAVAPGEYRLFAWETLEIYSYFDPQLIQTSMPFSHLVRVGESETVDVAIQAQ